MADGGGDPRPLVAMRGVVKRFGGVLALADGTFDLRAGEVHALVGANGAGKSTLMKILGGALHADSGTIAVDGAPWRPERPAAARTAGVHVVYQEFALVPGLSIAENLFLGCEPRRGPLWSRGVAEHRAREVLARLGLGRSERTPVGELSVAEQQLVEIGRAVAGDVRVLVLDEPTATLTDTEIERLFAITAELRRKGVGIVWISHRLDEVFAVADRITVMRDGRTVHGAETPAWTRRDVVTAMVGRELADEYPRSERRRGAVLLALEELAGPGYTDVSLSVHGGEVLGLFGLVGAGRTALARGVIGDPPPRRGRVRLLGEPVTFDGPAAALRHGVAYLTEDRKERGIVPHRSTAENVALAALRAIARRGWIDRRREARTVGDPAAAVGLAERDLPRPVGDLSGGNQQKALLARLLAVAPRVLLLDEPTRGIDVGARAEIYRVLDRIAAEGRAVLIISSELPEVLGVADRIAVMREGRLCGVLTRAEASAERVVRLATGVEDA